MTHEQLRMWKECSKIYQVYSGSVSRKLLLDQVMNVVFPLFVWPDANLHRSYPPSRIQTSTDVIRSFRLDLEWLAIQFKNNQAEESDEMRQATEHDMRALGSRLNVLFLLMWHMRD
jgi:hypothetical protein